VIPAAGYAHRLGTPAASKELLPVYSRPAADGEVVAPVCLCLLDAMRQAGIRSAHLVSRPGKEDIQRRIGDGTGLDMRIEHSSIEASRGPADTIDHVFTAVRDATVAIGFPDVLFEPLDVFTSLLARLDRTGADVVLGLFPTDSGGLDRVHVDEAQRVIEFEFDPPAGDAYDTWCLAVWTPRFTEFLHSLAMAPDAEERGEMILGRILQAGLVEGIVIEAVRPAGAWFIDVGSPAGLLRARNRLPTG
jgi:glucose-1-phosphate thymidylyltransferase